MHKLPATHSYETTRAQVAGYFDGTATRVWERLTSDAPVSRIRQTVRAGRDDMRALMLAQLPADLGGARVLDAGCGTGAACEALAARGADVLGIDISPKLVTIAQRRMPAGLPGRVDLRAGDMLASDLGQFDYVIAMDSLIYYTRPDLQQALQALSARAPHVVFTVAPRTPLLQLMWHAGKAFPRADRSPRMVPQDWRRLQLQGLGRVGRISSGFYISECLEVRR
jgi:magnesium-protoporphyrin O-methyltransferase